MAAQCETEHAAAPQPAAAPAARDGDASSQLPTAHPAASDAAGADGTCGSQMGDLTHRSTVTVDSSTADHDEERFGSSAGAAGDAGSVAALAHGASRSGSRWGSATNSSRPLSALHELRDLRGSRPNSAAVAAQIEGFDTDFLLPPGNDAQQGTVLDDVPEQLELQQASLSHPAGPPLGEDESGGSAQSSAAGHSPAQALCTAQKEHAGLLHANDALQRRARAVLEQRSKGRPAASRDLSRLDGADARFRSALKAWAELREECERVAAHFQGRVTRLKADLEARIRRADDVSSAFAHYKREVCLAAEHSTTGKPFSDKALAALEAKERVVDEELQRARLKNIHLANALKKLEASIREKELADGLHLIDFEQLKIENQSLNEKTEERNEELAKLRKKTALTVQILTHVKEKLSFVEQENSRLEASLAQLDAELAGRRDELAGLKATRDRLRARGRALKDGSTFVTGAALLADMQAQKERRDDLLAEIAGLRQQHAMITCGGASPCGSRRRGAGSGSGLQPAPMPSS